MVLVWRSLSGHVICGSCSAAGLYVIFHHDEVYVAFNAVAERTTPSFFRFGALLLAALEIVDVVTGPDSWYNASVYPTKACSSLFLDAERSIAFAQIEQFLRPVANVSRPFERASVLNNGLECRDFRIALTCTS